MTDAQNPYSPPKSEVVPVEANRPIVPASKGRRFGTLLVDYALFMALSFCVGLFVAFLFGSAGIKALQAVPDLVLGVLILSSYYIFFEGIWARTPEKFLFGTVVVSETGTKPGLCQVMGRTLCRFIPFEPFSCFRERGWHDSIPKTSVVLARAL